MRNTFLLIFFLISTLLYAQEVPMTSLEVESFKKKVAEESQRTKSLKLDFTQYKHLDFLSEDVKTYGRVFFKAPSSVRWEYTEPYLYSVIFKSKQLIINDNGNQSKIDIGSNVLFKKLNELIVSTVSGNMFYESDFDIDYYKSPKYNKVVFKPKDKKLLKYIAFFELQFDKEDAQVVQVKMIEPSEDYTKIVFSNRTLNLPIDDSVFEN